MMQSITQKPGKHILRAKFSAALSVIIILLVTFQFAIEPTPPKSNRRTIQCRTLFEQLDCSLKFGFYAVDWGYA